jgi:hypothetical protein
LEGVFPLSNSTLASRETAPKHRPANITSRRFQMLFTFVVVMAGIVLLMMTADHRRQPSRRGRNAGDGSSWGGGDGGSGDLSADCFVDAGGCDGGGGGGD